MNKGLIAVLVLVLLLPLIASVQMAQPAAGEVLQSDKERITSPDVSTSEQELLVKGNSAFAFELYQELKGEEGNLFYSPYSISLALAKSRWLIPFNSCLTRRGYTLHLTGSMQNLPEGVKAPKARMGRDSG